MTPTPQELAEIHRKLATLAEIANRSKDNQLDNAVQELLDQCPDLECMDCGRAVCPDGEPLHFHHDGCPVCSL